MTKTPNLSINLIHPNQAQKEVTTNEAIIMTDGLLNNNLKGMNVNTAPTTLSPGDLYHIGGAPTGEWIGYQGKMALYSEGGWRYFAPKTGLLLWSATGALMVYVNGNWTTV